MDSKKVPIESLTKEELVNKCRSLLVIAKQAKTAKDELAEKNRKLQESLATCEEQCSQIPPMKQLLEEFSNNKVRMSSEITELQIVNKSLKNDLESSCIEKESLQRQINRLTNDNESLLGDIDQMEQQLKEANDLVNQQKGNMDMLECEINKLREQQVNSDNINSTDAQCEHCEANCKAAQELHLKCECMKRINSEQRTKFHNLRERFIEVHKKLKQLKECKRILVETHYEYADSISKWQEDIKQASEYLCDYVQSLTDTNSELKMNLEAVNGDFLAALSKCSRLVGYCDQAKAEYSSLTKSVNDLLLENEMLKNKIESFTQMERDRQESLKETDILKSLNQTNKDHRTGISSELTTDSDDNNLIAHSKQMEEELIHSRKEIERLASLHVQLQEETASVRTVLTEELEHLRLQNKQLEEHTKTLQATTETQTIYYDKFTHSGHDSTNPDFDLIAQNAILSRLPNLIVLCDKALEDQQNLLKLIEEHKSDSVLNDAQNSTFEEGDSLRSKYDILKQNSLETEAMRDKLEAELGSFKQLCQDLEDKLKKKDHEHNDLLNEMRELNEALKGRGDVISKQEKKYQELLAEMKTKSAALITNESQLAEKNAIIQEKEQTLVKLNEEHQTSLDEVNALQSETLKKEKLTKALTEELVSLRAQIDNNDAQSELSTSTVSRAEQSTQMREVDDSIEEKYNKLRAFAIKLKKKNQEQSSRITDLESQLTEASRNLTTTGDKFTTLESERGQLQVQISSLKSELEKLKTTKSKVNVLNLELEAFERSLNETTAKLAAKTSEHDILAETLQSKLAIIENLKKEITILETSQESEKQHSIELKKHIDKLQYQLKDAIHSKLQICGKLDESHGQNQSLLSNLEEIHQRLTSLIQTNENDRSMYLKEKEQLLQTINSLKEEVNTSTHRAILAERSFQDLNQEFTSYRIKAQSVLRQNQTRETSKEQELEEEIGLLRLEIAGVTQRSNLLAEKVKTNEKIVEEVREENKCLQARTLELVNKISEQHNQLALLTKENKQHIATYQETLKSHRLQMEALESCHLQQIADITAKHEHDLSELRAQQKKDSEPCIKKPHERLDYMFMDRDDAEGSETDTAHIARSVQYTKRSPQHMIPLEELLNSQNLDDSYAVLERRQSVSSYTELHETKDRLQKQETQVRHLTSLLAESEQDLVKLTQLNEILKEELRRQERTTERDKHMHNSEYIKNVVLKFVSLNNSDERIRLVPVLNTVLGLSPSETELLQNIAKGKDNNNKTWGSILTNWSTG